MSLRRSPSRTPALLAANRSNARRSTGPRTPEGKSRSALNALKHGRRAQALDILLTGPAGAEFRQLRQAVWEAIVPLDGWEQKAVDRVACVAWTAKRQIGSRVASPAGRSALFAPGRGFPMPWRFRLKRPRWKVSVSVWMRRGRGKHGQRVRRPAHGWQEGQGRLHMVVTVTASPGHPRYRLHPGPLGCVALRKVFRTKPEYLRKKAAWEYAIVAAVPKSRPPRRGSSTARRRTPTGHPLAGPPGGTLGRVGSFLRRLLGAGRAEGAPGATGSGVGGKA